MENILKIICDLEHKDVTIVNDCAKNITGIECDYKQYLGFDCANKSLGYTMAIINVNLIKQLDVISGRLLDCLENCAGDAFSENKNCINANIAAKTLVQKKKTGEILEKSYDSFASVILNSEHKDIILRAMIEYHFAVYFLKVTYFIPQKYGVIDLIPGKKLKESEILERTRALKRELKKLEVSASTIVLVEEQPTVLNSKSTTIQDQIMYEYCDNEVKEVPPRWKNTICFGEGLSYEEIRQKYAKKYTANKVHSKLNFRKLISTIGENKMLNGIKKENYDDLADSTMQIIAYVKFNNPNI